MEVDEAEKKNFYDRYVKKMTLAIDKDGIMTIKIPDWFLDNLSSLILLPNEKLEIK